MSIILRPELELNADDQVVIHMGEGAARSVIRSAINNYWKYKEIRQPGVFAVSVYGAIGGVSEEMIVAAMPHRKYGTATYGQLRASFEVLPTTIQDADLPENIKAVHFDIVLPTGGFRLPSGPGADDLTDDQLVEAGRLLAAPVDQLLSQFVPRRSK